MASELYNRQEELDLEKYDKVLVVGAGGIGSWFVFDLALSGCAKEIHVCDPDVVEESNLNRTPFAQSHIGMRKTWAIREIIAKRRHDVVIIPMDGIVQNQDIDAGEYDVVVDCSDGLMVKEWAMSQKFASYMKLGYDGWSITMDFSSVMPWDEGDTGYRTVPSFVVPPQILASMAVGILLSGNVPNEVKTFDVRDIFAKI